MMSATKLSGQVQRYAIPVARVPQPAVELRSVPQAGRPVADANGLTFAGEFLPPAMAASVVPVKLGGRGSVRIEGDLLIVEGAKTGDASGMIVLGVVAAILVCGVLAALGAAQSMVTGAAVAVMGSVISTAVSRVTRTRADAPRERHTYEIRRAVRSVSKYGADGLVLIHIAGAKPKGGLYFRPDDGPDRLIATLAAKR